MPKTNELESVLKTMPLTGECEIDITKAVKIWNDSLSISQFNEHYQLVKFYSDGTYGKVTISKKQAHELIGSLDLIDEPSMVFGSGRTWKQKISKSSSTCAMRQTSISYTQH